MEHSTSEITVTPTGYYQGAVGTIQLVVEASGAIGNTFYSLREGRVLEKFSSGKVEISR